MNVLFVLYGGLDTNSAVPLMTHARQLHQLGWQCAVAIPQGRKTSAMHDPPFLRTALYAEALSAPTLLFPDGRPADILHAWTPREGVRRFVSTYEAQWPTPWIIYLEDNEGWIARTALALVGLREDVLLQHTEEVISTWTPDRLSHPLRYESFIGLADAAVVIQDKLAVEVPPWVPCMTVMPGVDLEFFSPQNADPALRRRYGVADEECVVVYPGGLNGFTRPGLEALCRAVGLMNRQGTPCRLLRSGPFALDFLERLTPEAAAAVTDLGELPRSEMPGLLALADVFIQPGKSDVFEDLRLPGKLPELLATGRPVVLPDTNIADLFQDGVDAVLHRTGTPEEIAQLCLALFADPERARKIGEAGRRFAETHFDPKAQAARLEGVYRATCAAFRPEIAAKLWTSGAEDMPVPALLARKLRLLARVGGGGAAPSGEMLRTHARCIEFAVERSQGLETGIVMRDREITALKGDAKVASEKIAALTQTVAERDYHIAAVQSSLSWRLTRPLRTPQQIASRLRSYFRS